MAQRPTDPCPTRGRTAVLFRDLFTVLRDDPAWARLTRGDDGLSLHVVFTQPDLALYVDRDGVLLDEVPRPPRVRLAHRTQDAHALWSGRLPFAAALGSGRLTVEGRLPEVLELVLVLPTVRAVYAALSARDDAPRPEADGPDRPHRADRPDRADPAARRLQP